MANTFTQIHLQLVFAVKYRQALIQKSWHERLHTYITGIVQNHGHKMLQINSRPDHIHILIGYRPSHPLPKLVEEIKTFPMNLSMRTSCRHSNSLGKLDMLCFHTAVRKYQSLRPI